MIIPLEAVESRTSSTNTLVARKLHKTPHYLKNVVHLSLLTSTLAFIFAVISVTVYHHQKDIPVPAAIAYVATLLHHGAVLFRYWLERHHSEHIFPFTPASAYAISYSCLSCALWAVSTVVAAKSLRRDLAGWPNCHEFAANVTPFASVNCDSMIHYQPPMSNTWCSFALTLTSALEMFLAGTVTLAFYFQYRRATRATIAMAASSAGRSPAVRDSKTTVST